MIRVLFVCTGNICRSPTAEGVLRAHRLSSDAKPRDSARYSIIASEWPQVRAHLQAKLAAR